MTKRPRIKRIAKTIDNDNVSGFITNKKHSYKSEISAPDQKRIEYYHNKRNRGRRVNKHTNKPITPKSVDYNQYQKFGNCGVMLISFGFEYDKIAPYCAESIRRYSDIPITIHTNIIEEHRNPKWSNINNINFVYYNMNDDENRVVKTQLGKYTEYEKTIYIDVDSEVLSDEFLNPLNMLVDDCYMVCPEWKILNIEKLKIKRKDFYQTLKVINFQEDMLVSGGICYFIKNDTTDDMFDLFYEKWIETGKGKDMPGLNHVFFKYKQHTSYLPKTKYNNTNSTIIRSFHSTNKIHNNTHKDFTRKRYCSKDKIWKYVKQGTEDFFEKPTIYCLYDHIGWAFHNKIESLKQQLNPYYQITPIKTTDFNKKNDVDNIALLFTPPHLRHIKNKKNVICGVSSTFGRTDQLHTVPMVFSNDINIYNKINHKNKYYLPNGVNTEFWKTTHQYKISNKKEYNIGVVGSESRSKHKGEDRVKQITQTLNHTGYKVNNNSLFVTPEKNSLSKKDLKAYYENLDFLIISSVSETGPNPLLEASSMGLPVIGNNTGMVGLILDNSPYNRYMIEDHNNIQEYVNKIKYLIDNPVEYEKYSEYLKERIKEYDWKEMAKGYKVMIDDFINLKNKQK